MKNQTLVIFLALAIASISTLKLFTASTSEEIENEKFSERFQNDYNIYALALPENIDFAGESVPLNLVDVRERLDRELLVNTYWQSQTLLLLKRSSRWFPQMEKILQEEGIPEDFKYLALIESGLMNVVSPAGATGFWQLMKEAARENGLEVNNHVDERYHVEKSTRAACAYLRDAKEKFGTWTLAAASYNMGKAGIEKQIDRQKATNYYDLVLGEETSRYIFRILAAKIILSDPEKYGFIYREEDLYRPYVTSAININKTIDDLADFAFEHQINYKALKTLNPWLRENYLPNPTGQSYTILLPSKPLSDELVNDKAQVSNFARSREKNTNESGEEIPGE